MTNDDEAMNFQRLSNYLPLGLVAMCLGAKIADYAHLAAAGPLKIFCYVAIAGLMAAASIVFVLQRFNVLPKSKEEEAGSDFDCFTPSRQPIAIAEQLVRERQIAPRTALLSTSHFPIESKPPFADFTLDGGTVSFDDHGAKVAAAWTIGGR